MYMHKRYQSHKVRKTEGNKKLEDKKFNELVKVMENHGFKFLLELRFGESESNRHHPAVNHNYTF